MLPALPPTHYPHPSPNVPIVMVNGNMCRRNMETTFITYQQFYLVSLIIHIICVFYVVYYYGNFRLDNFYV